MSDEGLAGAFSLTAVAGEVRESMAFSDETGAVLESSVREALRLGHNDVGTEHILLGVIANSGLSATHVLAGVGVTTDVVEPRVLEALGFFLAGRERRS